MFKLYMVVNQNNGKLYIGKTCQPLERRWKHHIFLAEHGTDFYFYRAIRKHGVDNFLIHQIDGTESEQEASELERLYIGIFKSHKPEHGYNSTLGGEGVRPNEQTRLKMKEAASGTNSIMFGRKHSEESKKKMSVTRKAHPMVGPKNPMYGKHPSEETRAKLRAARVGKKPNLGIKHSDEAKRKMSESRTGTGNHFYGKHHSEESKRKISLSKLGKRLGIPRSEETKRKISETKRANSRNHNQD